MIKIINQLADRYCTQNNNPDMFVIAVFSGIIKTEVQ